MCQVWFKGRHYILDLVIQLYKPQTQIPFQQTHWSLVQLFQETVCVIVSNRVQFCVTKLMASLLTFSYKWLVQEVRMSSHLHYPPGTVYPGREHTDDRQPHICPTSPVQSMTPGNKWGHGLSQNLEEQVEILQFSVKWNLTKTIWSFKWKIGKHV